MAHFHSTGANEPVRRRRLVTAVLGTLVLGVSHLGAVSSVSAGGSGSPLVVIVHKDNPTTNISADDLRRIFKSEPVNTPSGKTWVPFNHPPKTRDRAYFDETLLRMNPDEVAKFWIDRRIRGRKGPPRTVVSKTLLLRVVARLPRAIAYIRHEDLNSSVKAVRIDGKAPTDKGYLLR